MTKYPTALIVCCSILFCVSCDSHNPLDEAVDCHSRMISSLADDSRYIPMGDYDEDRDAVFLEKFNALQSIEKQCADDVEQSHRNSVYERCMEMRCGENIGGGCEHIANYSITFSVIEHAVTKCVTTEATQ